MSIRRAVRHGPVTPLGVTCIPTTGVLRRKVTPKGVKYLRRRLFIDCSILNRAADIVLGAFWFLRDQV